MQGPKSKFFRRISPLYSVPFFLASSFKEKEFQLVVSTIGFFADFTALFKVLIWLLRCFKKFYQVIAIDSCSWLSMCPVHKPFDSWCDKHLSSVEFHRLLRPQLRRTWTIWWDWGGTRAKNTDLARSSYSNNTSMYY